MRALAALLLIVAALLLGSCRSSQGRQREVSEQSRYCEPAFRFAYDSTYLPLPGIEALYEADTALRIRYSLHDVKVANAAGAVSLLRELTRLEKSPDADHRLERLEKREQVHNRLLLASAQVASLAAELDCEAERAARLAAYLNQREGKRTQWLTILSIVAGAGGTVASALIDRTTPNQVADIGGGVLAAGFGGMALLSSKKSIRLVHDRNLLADAWKPPPQSAVYPPFVWHVLNEGSFSYSGKHPILYNIRRRWQMYILLGGSAGQEQLYFGTGGDYQTSDLSNRAQMLKELEAAVRLINQDLQSLLLNFSRQQ